MSCRQRVRAVLEAEAGQGSLGRAVAIFLFALIVANVIAAILETVAAVRSSFATTLEV